MQNIILLHGALGAQTDLETLAEALKSERLKIWSFSFSGHGGSAFKESFTIGQFTAELHDFITGNDLAGCIVFGYSMGGYVALNLAQQKPALVNKIVTLGTKFNWSQEAVNKETALLKPELVTEKMPQLEGSLKAKHGENWQELLQKTAGMMQEICNTGYLNEAALKTITMPVLLGLADKDKMVSLEETVNVFKTLPNAGMYMLPHTRHLLETADTRLLSRLIRDFIART